MDDLGEGCSAQEGCDWLVGEGLCLDLLGKREERSVSVLSRMTWCAGVRFKVGHEERMSVGEMNKGRCQAKEPSLSQQMGGQLGDTVPLGSVEGRLEAD